MSSTPSTSSQKFDSRAAKMAGLTSPINTSIQLPPPVPLVSPITLNSAGPATVPAIMAGSPTPTPGAEMKPTFWSSGPSPHNGQKSFWAMGSTPTAEKRRGFWSPVQSPSKEKEEMWSGPKPPVPEKMAVASSSAQKQKSHKVSWSDSSWDSDRSKGQSSHEPESSQSENSRPNSPDLPERVNTPNTESSTESNAAKKARARVIELVDKKIIAMARPSSPQPQVTPKDPPFVAYTDSFLHILGPQPTMVEVIEDKRAPFFGGSGCFHRPTSTLFLTSALIKDPSPGAISSRYQSTVTTSITFFSGIDATRDKVRFSENYMPAGSCVWLPATSSTKSQSYSSTGQKPTPTGSPTLSSSLIMCARGTLGTPAGLIQVSPRRPHTVTPILTSYPSGRHFNSPHSVVALSDGSLLFTDPPVGYEVGYRPRPQLPPLVHRFDPATGDVRAVADGLTRPTCIAVSPDERTVYVVDAPRPRKQPGRGQYFEDVLEACCAPTPTIQAYTLVGVTQGIGPGASGVFLTNKRLFAFPGLSSESEPLGLAVSARGDLFVACGPSGILVYAKDGTLVGRVRVEKGETVSGVCLGRKGELFAWGGSKLWQINVDAARLG